MKKIDIAAMPILAGSNYPAPFNEPCEGQLCRRLARGAGLTQFGVNLTTIDPGSWSSQRHWHTHEDEFVYVLAGTVTLLEGETASDMRPGDAATFKAGWRLGIVSKTGRTRMSPISSSAPARRTRWCITPRRICC